MSFFYKKGSQCEQENVRSWSDKKKKPVTKNKNKNNSPKSKQQQHKQKQYPQIKTKQPTQTKKKITNRHSITTHTPPSSHKEQIPSVPRQIKKSWISNGHPKSDDVTNIYPLPLLNKEIQSQKLQTSLFLGFFLILCFAFWERFGVKTHQTDHIHR